jgi:hypothetical protein
MCKILQTYHELAWLFDSGLYETIKHGLVRIDEI